MASITCGNCKQTHGSAAEVKTCHGNSGKLTGVDLPKPTCTCSGIRAYPSQDCGVHSPTNRTPVPEALKPQAPVATQKQVDYIDSLLRDRQWETLNGHDYERAFDVAGGKDITKAEASSLIEALRNAPRVPKAEKKTPEGAAVTEDGMYVNGDGKVFKVQVAVHGSGQLYAKQLNTETGKFEYVGRKPLYDAAMTPLTLEQAQELGHLYGMCCVCGRTLTDENSIAAGIGPICAEKF